MKKNIGRVLLIESSQNTWQEVVKKLLKLDINENERILISNPNYELMDKYSKQINEINFCIEEL